MPPISFQIYIAARFNNQLRSGNIWTQTEERYISIEKDVQHWRELLPDRIVHWNNRQTIAVVSFMPDRFSRCRSAEAVQSVVLVRHRKHHHEHKHFLAAQTQQFFSLTTLRNDNYPSIQSVHLSVIFESWEMKLEANEVVLSRSLSIGFCHQKRRLSFFLSFSFSPISLAHIIANLSIRLSND